MLKHLRTSALAFATLVTPSIASAQESVEQIFVKYLNGNTAHFVSNGRTGYVYYRSIQRPELWVKETNFSDKGMVTFKDAQTYCASWDKIRNGASRCFRIKTASETKMLVEATDNGEQTEVNILKGNPQGF